MFFLLALAWDWMCMAQPTLPVAQIGAPVASMCFNFRMARSVAISGWVRL